MAIKQILIICLLSACSFAKAQQEVSISKDMFDRQGQIVLDDFDEWLFHLGNDSTWAQKDIDVSNWKKFKPSDLSVEIADETGRVEGWFRIKISLDTTVVNLPLFLYKEGREAAEVYLDGELVKSYGKMGIDRKTYREYMHFQKPPVPIDLESNSTYTLAVHFIEYTAMFPKRLKSVMSGPLSFLSITGKEFYDNVLYDNRTDPIYRTVVISVGSILLILFWFLSFQSSNDLKLLLVAICASLFALPAAFSVLSYTEDVSFAFWRMNFGLNLLFMFANLAIIPLLVSKIFTDRISSRLKYLALGMFLFGVINILIIWHILPMLVCIVLSQSVSVYFLVKYWKGLKGAQWAIVVGLIVSLLGFLVTVSQLVSDVELIDFMIISSFGSLALPLSLLAYVIIRFKEVINEVKENADKVVSITEEKKKLVENQNVFLEQQVKERTSELSQSIENLKSTQAQLIQSEKMASLGELTAGIAHEIQNPLNFVNNFSEVSNELIDEMNEEMEKGDLEEAKAISVDIKQNLEKINHHGKRADAIVKGMLQHSRTSSAEKEPTDLNALADEYLRLSYHGLRAKDKTFNSDLKTNFDASLPKANVSQQDIGRVLFNLVSNAFYAVNEKVKMGIEGYQPLVTISTAKVDNHIEIKVADNGSGIPDNIKDKIFQPFFTTKPTGQGTGLGLSLSYDIVKAHGGKLKVTTKQNEGTEFIIQLPE